jgi:hypothetical protein
MTPDLKRKLLEEAKDNLESRQTFLRQYNRM